MPCICINIEICFIICYFVQFEEAIRKAVNSGTVDCLTSSIGATVTNKDLSNGGRI